MALTWDTIAVADRAAIGVGAAADLTPEQRAEWATTEAIIWMTIAVGMGEITEANWHEFYARARYYEQLSGSFRQAAYITATDVHRRIGLRTNVSVVPRARWAAKIAKGRMDAWASNAEVNAEAVPV